MLDTLGLDDVDQLFQPIPSDLRAPADLDLPGPTPSRRWPPSSAGWPRATGTWTS